MYMHVMYLYKGHADYFQQNVVLDGHHKLHAAALERRPVAVLAIASYARYYVRWMRSLASVGYDARVYAHESAYHTAHHNHVHNPMARDPEL